jgi:hypothetical protein
MKTKEELRPHAEALAEDMTKLCGSVIAKGLLGILEVCVEQKDRIAELERQVAKLRAAFHVNMLRAYPDKTHAEIAEAIDAALAQANKEGANG